MSDPEFNANRERGFYAPFPIPIHVEDEPAHQPDEEPLVWICFNEDYLPYVHGALKALASELTFEGPRSCVASWVQSMMNLLLKEPCECAPSVPPTFDYIWDVNVENGGATTFYYDVYNLFPFGQFGRLWIVKLIASEPDLLAMSVDITAILPAEGDEPVHVDDAETFLFTDNPISLNPVVQWGDTTHNQTGNWMADESFLSSQQDSSPQNYAHEFYRLQVEIFAPDAVLTILSLPGYTHIVA